MYLHIGKRLILNDDDIIAILNIDYIKNTKEYKNFYQELCNENKVNDISCGNHKSLILFQKNKEIKVYVSNINSNTIGKRKF